MKSKIILIVAILVFVALIVCAGVLYDKLGEDNNSGGLIIDMPTTNTSKTESTENADVGIGTDSDAINQETDENASDMPTTTPPEQSENTTGASSTEPVEEPTNPAPDFTMVDINGKQIRLSELRGKPVVLNFWASWCGYCVAEMPDFEEYYKIYGNDIHFVMLNTLSGGETLSSGKKFISEKKYTFPVYFDEGGLASQLYGANAGIPKTFFIDAKGNLVAHCPGMLDADILKEGIDMIS